LLGILV